MLSRNYFLQHRYRIIRPLGKGGFGQVYEALDDKLDSIVAIKERLAKLDSEKLRRAFEREAKLLANLRHPVLPKVSDHFFEGQGQYLVMEFIEGDDLSMLLAKRQSPFALKQVLSWADGILRALEYLHARSTPIIHRDIKPANIKLTTEGEIFLLDFGLAKGYAGGMPLPGTSQRSSSVHGYTAAYAPLEQLNNSGTTEQSDIYSLGATLYHLLTGRVPVAASQRYQTIELGERDSLLPVHEINPSLPFSVSLVLSQAMAMSRRDRIKSANQMRLALNEARLALEAEDDRSETEPYPDEISVNNSIAAESSPEPQPSDTGVPVPAEASPTVASPTMRAQQTLEPTLPVKQPPQMVRPDPKVNVEPTPPPEFISRSSTPGKEISWPSQVNSEANDSPFASTIIESEPHDDEEDLTEQPRQQYPEAQRAQEAFAREDLEKQKEPAHQRLEAEAATPHEVIRPMVEAATVQSDDLNQASTMVVAPNLFEVMGASHSDAPPPDYRNWFIIGGFSVLLVIGAIAALVLFNRPVTSSPVVESGATNTTNTTRVEATVPTAVPREFGLKQILSDHHGKIWSVAFSPDGRIAAAAGEDQKIRLWDAHTWQSRLTLEGHRGDINSIAFSPEGQLIASGSSDQTIRLWDTTYGAQRKTLSGHSGRVLYVAFSPDGKLLASASTDKTIRLWDTETGREVAGLLKHQDEVWCVAFSRDGSTLASAGRDKTIRLWDVKSATELRSFPAKDAVFLSFSPDGLVMASGHNDKTIKLWNWKTGELLRTLTDHQDYVSSIAFSPDGKLLASASKDKTIKLWSVQSGKLLQSLTGDTDGVESVSFAPDGTTLISGSRDQTVRIWQY